MKKIFIFLIFPAFAFSQPDSQMGFGAVMSGDTLYLVRNDTVYDGAIARYVQDSRAFPDSISLDQYIDTEIENLSTRRDKWLEFYSRDSLEVLRLMKVKSELGVMGFIMTGQPPPPKKRVKSQKSPINTNTNKRKQ